MDENYRFFFVTSGLAASLALILTAWAGGWLLWVRHPNTVTAVVSAILAVTAVVALVFAYKTAETAIEAVRDAKRTRHGQLVTDLTARWDSEAMNESQQLFSLHGPTTIKDLYQRLYSGTEPVDRDELALLFRLEKWPNLIDTISVLWSEGALTGDVIYKMWGIEIVATWESGRNLST